MDTRARELWGLGVDQAGLRTLTEHSPDVIMVLNLECEIQFINWTAPGLSVEEVVGTPIYRYVPEVQHEEMARCFRAVLESGAPGTYRNVYEIPGGTPLHWESRVGPIHRGNETVGFTVFSRDVTERNARAVELDQFFELSIDFLCVANAKGYFTRVNPTFTRALGFSESELLEHPFVDFVHPEDVAATLAVTTRLSEGHSVIGFENRYRTKSGKYRLLAWQASADPERGRLFGAARDITDQRALEVQLRQSQKMDAVGRLAGGIAHDFNNLMFAVLVNSEFASEATRADQEELRARLADITRAGQRAADLTRQLLAFSRQAPIAVQAVDLSALVRELVNLLRRLIPEHIEVDLVAGQELPRVAADPGQLEQVLMNLCVNARDAMRKGGRLTIRTEAVDVDSQFCETHPWAEPGRFVLLSVTDTGDGMTSAVRERVFEPFFTTKAPGDGTGLGLATVYAITKQHGGFLHLESEPGAGASFEVYLPAAGSGTKEAAPKSERPSQGGRETVLVAEDEPLVRSAVVSILEHAGYRVLAACNGREALDLLEANATDVALAILDVVMPELSGPETYTQLKARLPSLPVLFSSGYTDDTRLQTSVPVDAVFLSKPYRSAELLRRVRDALDAHER